MKTLTKKNHGFSLIEVMLAVFILSIGILAVAKFQGTLLKSGSETKARAAALTLAQQKIDDLRGFGQLEAATDCSGTCDWSSFTASELNSKQMAYAYISNDNDGEGGRLAPNSTFNLSFNNENYKRTWEVKDETDEPDKLESMKLVKVSVAWEDQNGDTQTVSLESLIPAISPALTNVANPGAGASPTPPNFTYTPGAAPDVIKVEIDAGDGQYKETSKALPDVSQDGDNNLITFSAVTFTTSLGASTADNIDEYANINCKCTFNGTGSAYTPSRFVWNNETKQVYDKRGEVVTKITATENNNGSGSETVVAALCTQCCRDHHDSDLSDVKYVIGTSSGNHTHYDSSGVQVTGGDYLEVCRFNTIDGIISTFQDWQLKTSTVLPSSYLADGASTQSLYKNYVADYVANSTTGGSLPTALTARDITSLPQGGSDQLLVRAIYIDKVEQESSEYTTCVDGIGTPDDACENVNAIKITPFVEINLTKLANWSSTNCTDNGGSGACVSDEPIEDESLSENNYSRGLVTADGTTTLNAVTTIEASINTGNSGIVGEAKAVDHLTDSVTATVSASIATFDITGNIGLCSITGSGSNTRKSNLIAAIETTGAITYSGSSSGNCTVSGNGANSRTMTCSSIPSASADVTIAVASVSPIVASTLSNYANIPGAATNVGIVICDY